MYRFWLFILCAATIIQGQPIRKSSETPVFLYGPTTTFYIARESDSLPAEAYQNKTLPAKIGIRGGKSKAYLLLEKNQIIEISAGSDIFVNRDSLTIILKQGRLILYPRDTATGVRYRIVNVNGSIINLGGNVLSMGINDSLYHIPAQGALLSPEDKAPSKKWVQTTLRDKEYIDELYSQGKLFDPLFPVSIPSLRPKKFKFSTQQLAGMATYEGLRYYHAGTLLRFRYSQMEFVYLIYLAASNKGKFYTENWNELKDFISNIYYFQLFKPEDPWFLRLGMIENLSLGRGYLVDNYSNTVVLPFERLNGFEIRAKSTNYKFNLFFNDIIKPRVFGTYFSWRHSKKLTLDVTYIGDINQYSNINDKDGDSYPDMIDPNPNQFDKPIDSLQRLDKIKTRYFHALSAGSEYEVFKLDKGSGIITGEIAAYSNVSLGCTFPNLLLRFPWVQFSIGTDLQSPDFVTSIFDRSYEYNKARFIEDDSGHLELISRVNELNQNNGWLYGWNNMFKLNLPGYIELSSKYRHVFRGSTRDKLISFSIKNYYPFTPYLVYTSFFIEQKNFKTMFDQKRDGEIWGFAISIKPHKTIMISLRYREQFRDKNGDSFIRSGEAKRNFGFNVTAKLDYWYKKWKKSRQERQQLDDEFESIEE